LRVSRWAKIFLNAAKAWNADDVFKHSAAVSFCALFSIAPITIIVVTLAGFFLGPDVAGLQLEKQVGALVGPASAELIKAVAKASQAQSNSVFATVVGVALVLVGATSVFGQLQGSLNEIWGVRTKPSKSGWAVLVFHRFVSFAMVLTIGFLLLISLVLTTMLSSAIGYFGQGRLGLLLLKIADAGVGLVVITGLFTLLFKVMPDIQLRWKDVGLGAAVTGVLFTVGRYLIALYLAHSTVASVYGAAGSLVAVLIWVYYSCAILFYGVEFTRVYRQEHHLKIEPKATAEAVRLSIVTRHARSEHIG
jgi:membrane protein